MDNSIVRKDCEELCLTLSSLIKEELSNKTFLITGSNGLIGNYFVTLFDVLNEKIGSDINVYCISKHSPIWKNDNFHYITLDLAQPFSFVNKVDYIIHAACYATPTKFLANKLETFELNVNTTKKLLQIAQMSDGKLLFLSSGAIYGQPSRLDIPIQEAYIGNYSHLSSRGVYTESKKMGEVLCSLFGDLAKVVRLGYIYGPGNCEGRVMSDFIKMAKNNGKVIVTGSGDEKHCYCYITDAINMMLHVLLEGRYFVYNVDGKSLMSIEELAKSIAEYFNIEYSLSNNDTLISSPKLSMLNISKVQNEFNINKFVSFDEGLKRTIKWNLENKND
jgi:UDP-glucuronate decarboxylase